MDPYSAYKKKTVETLTPVEVVIKLYSEIERQLAIAVNSVEKNDRHEYQKAHDAFIKAENCIDALRETLDMSIPISQELENYYIFFYKTIVNADIHKDATEVKKIIPLVAELRDAFTQISQMTRQEIEAQKEANNKKKGVG